MGLQAIHDNKIIHGDIKPENILVFSVLHGDRPKKAKLADFGASLFEEDQHEQLSYSGTPLYNAPDTRRPTANGLQRSIDSSPVSERWSLGQGDTRSNPVFQTLLTSQARFAQRTVVAGIFGSVRTLQTHWEIQRNVFNDLSNSVNPNSSNKQSLTYHSNCLHLALSTTWGLGVIFFELVQWKPVTSRLKVLEGQPLGSGDLKKEILATTRGDVFHMAGQSIADVIETCLNFGELTNSLDQFEAHCMFKEKILGVVARLARADI
ncbi:kinase-like domain-containing protein [Hypoxylon sp. NC0597]|nr:kinase-like domain-containing protein [Hypoxylon sp. NC0597]